MKNLLTTTLVFLLTLPICLAQTRETLEINQSYGLAKIYTKKNQILKGRNLTLMNDSIISYKNNKSYQTETLNINDLRSLKVKYGTKVVPYALYGAGSMAVISLLAWGEVEADPNLETKDNVGPIIAGFIVGGAVIGGIVGLVTPKWKNIAIPRKKSGNASLFLYPTMGVQKDYYVLSLKIKF